MFAGRAAVSRKFPVKKEFDREFGGVIRSSELVSERFDLSNMRVLLIIIIIFTWYLSPKGQF